MTQTLGWFVRRVPDADPIIRFYDEVVGLPYMRGGKGVSMHWLGGTATLEVNTGGSKPPIFKSAADVWNILILRCSDLDAHVQRLKAAGVTFLPEEQDTSGRTAYFLDPMGHVTGLRQRLPASTYIEDRDDGRTLGPSALEGIRALPAGVQAIGWVVRRVQDVAAETAFYRDGIGLPVLEQTPERAVLDLGERIVLELLPGGSQEPVPADRALISNAFVVRVFDFDARLARVRAAHASVVNAPFNIVGGRITYLCDPEGHLFGIQQRTAASDRIEDQLADQLYNTP